MIGLAHLLASRWPNVFSPSDRMQILCTIADLIVLYFNVVWGTGQVVGDLQRELYRHIIEACN